ncbi:HAD family phosphatase [bacterium]|nr:HAD family phosphatase [bacterium]
MSGPVRSIVFDVGNVLFKYDPNFIIDQLLGDSPYRQLILEHLFLSEAWQKMDRGDLTIDTLVLELQDEIGSHPFLNELPFLVERFVDYLVPDSEMIGLFERLARRYAVYILSNFQDRPFDRLVASHPFFNLAHGIVVSAKVNMMKPETQIYSFLLNRYQLDPQSTVFIDDLPANIDSAERLGITGILYNTPTETIAKLRACGVEL